jgi:hypothetical protein
MSDIALKSFLAASVVLAQAEQDLDRATVAIDSAFAAFNLTDQERDDTLSRMVSLCYPDMSAVDLAVIIKVAVQKTQWLRLNQRGTQHA